MIASRRALLELTLSLCLAILAGLCAWLAALLLSQLALMEPVTAASAQSLADNGDALQFLASGAGAAEARYASARLWVWICIGANGAGAALFGLWLRAALLAPTMALQRQPDALPAPRAPLIERAMQRAGAPGTQVAHAMAPRLPPPAAAPALVRPTAPATPCGAEAAARLARIARIIDTLALQTTLLALNAAVEDARGSMPPRP